MAADTSDRAKYAASRSSSYVAIPAIILIGSLADVLGTASPSVVVAGLAATAVVVSWALFRRNVSSGEAIVALCTLAFYSPVGPRVNLSLTDVLVILALVHFAARAHSEGRPFLSESASSRYVLTYAWVLQCVILTSFLVASLSGSARTVGLIEALKLAIMSGAVLVVAVECRDLPAFQRLLTAWKYAATTVSALALAGFALHNVGVPTGLTYAFRARGTFEDPNLLATYLLMSLGLTMGATHMQRGRALSWHLLPMITAVFMTSSRAALVGVMVMLAFALASGWLSPSMGRLARALLAISALGGAALTVAPRDALSPVLSRFIGFGTTGLADDPVRERLWFSAAELWNAAPILGIGIGQFTHAASAHGAPSGLLAHNTYLSLLAETGIAGLVAFIWLPVAVGAALISRVARRDAIAPYILLSLLAFAVMAVSLNLQNFRPFWVLLGLATAYAACSVPRAQLSGFPSQLPGPSVRTAPRKDHR